MNLHPDPNLFRSRDEKEKLLAQHGIVLWFTGLSGSGKTTIAMRLEKALHERGILTQVLDGDNVRTGINRNLGFSQEDRTENIRRIAEVAKLFKDCGIITLCCFVSPTIEMRQMARGIIGPEDFREIYVNAPLAVCEQRDVKGLYAKARSGEIKEFTGIDSPFEPPPDPDLEICTAEISVARGVDLCLEELDLAAKRRGDE